MTNMSNSTKMAVVSDYCVDGLSPSTYGPAHARSPGPWSRASQGLLFQSNTSVRGERPESGSYDPRTAQDCGSSETLWPAWLFAIATNPPSPNACVTVWWVSWSNYVLLSQSVVPCHTCGWAHLQFGIGADQPALHMALDNSWVCASDYQGHESTFKQRHWWNNCCVISGISHRSLKKMAKLDFTVCDSYNGKNISLANSWFRLIAAG